MTLSKIISITNIGRFLDASASGDVTFGRYNLIFAENGRGKTTLCAILRSLQSGIADLIQGRATLGYPGTPRAEILLDVGPARYADGAWSRLAPSLAVFDATFVSENVYAGDAVDTEQRRNLYRTIIGTEGVALAREIEDLDARIRAANTDILDRSADVRQHAPHGMGVADFIALPPEPDIDAQIAAKEVELAAVRDAVRIRDRAALEPITLPSIPTDLYVLLARSIEGVAEDAQRRTSDHIAAHRMGNRGEAWLTEGLGFDHAIGCPFCGQDVRSSTLIEAYQAFFGAAYRALRDEASTFGDVLASQFGDAQIAKIEAVIARNAAGAEFWRSYIAAPFPEPIPGDRVAEPLRNVRNSVLALLNRKTSAPLESVSPNEDDQRLVADLDRATATAVDYNRSVDSANAAIAEKRRNTAAAVPANVEHQLRQLKGQRSRHTAEVSAACDAYLQSQGAKADLDTTKAACKAALDQHRQG